MTVDERLKDIMRRFEALDDIDRITKLTIDDKLNFVISIIKSCRQDGVEAERNSILTICEERLEEIRRTYSIDSPVDQIEKAVRLTEVNHIRSLIAERTKEKA
jgi:hypothetical protein